MLDFSRILKNLLLAETPSAVSSTQTSMLTYDNLSLLQLRELSPPPQQLIRYVCACKGVQYAQHAMLHCENRTISNSFLQANDAKNIHDSYK